MTMKEYLKQIKVLDHKIKHKESQLRELRSRIMQAGGVNYECERVQSSPKGDRIADEVIRMITLENDIAAERIEYLEKKQQIINLIYRLENATYIDVLIKRYVDGKSFQKIALDMNYSVSHVYALHRAALRTLQLHHNSI